jgi:hypothetical protein
VKSSNVWLWLAGIWLTISCMVALVPPFVELPTFVLVLFGGVRFVANNLSRMTYDTPALALGGAAMVLFVGLAHWVFRGFASRPHSTEVSVQPTIRWKWRWTFAVLAVVILMFAAGISLVGLTHQVVWVANSPEPMYEEVMGGWLGHTDPGSRGNDLKMIGMGFHNFHDTYKGLPGPKAKYYGGGHSWETLVTPYTNFSWEGLDMDKPWDDPANAEPCRKLHPLFLNPNFAVDTWRNAEGYGLSHYAANQHVIGPNGVATFAGITDGQSQTVLIGEVNANFEPWAKPDNWRDPALGLNRSSHGFGGVRNSHEVWFVMADGSVRLLKDNIDPAVLRALATPAAGDKAE